MWSHKDGVKRVVLINRLYDGNVKNGLNSKGQLIVKRLKQIEKADYKMCHSSPKNYEAHTIVFRNLINKTLKLMKVYRIYTISIADVKDFINYVESHGCI